MRRNSLLFCFCVVLLLLQAASASDEWISFRGDAENSGISNLSADLVDIVEVGHYIGGYGFYASPVVGDLDGDGTNEIVLCDEGGYVNVFSVDTQGVEKLWSKKITDAENSPRMFATEQSIGVLETGDSIRATPSLADLDGDGSLEIIAATKDGEVMALRSDGSLLWNFSVYDSFVSSPVVYDIDSDGSLEVMVTSSRGKVYCLDNAGSEEWTYELGSPVFGAPAVGVLSESGASLVVCSEEGNLTVLGGNGSKIWGYNLSDNVYAAPVLIDKDNDGMLEVMIATRGGEILILKGGKVDSRIVTGAPIMSSPLFIDIDGDSIAEIVYATYLETESHGAYYKNEENRIVAMEQSGSILWEVDTGGWPVFSSPVAADLDRDGKAEVLVTTNDGRIFMINEGDVVWIFNKGNGAYATPAIVNVDEDRDAEIVQAYFYGNEFYVLDSIPKADLVISDLRLSTPIPKNKENITVLVNVSNNGALMSHDSEVVLYKMRGDAEFEVGRENISGVGAGDSTSVNISWIAEMVNGLNELKVVVDAEGWVNESDELNNEMILDVPFDLRVIGTLPGGQINPGKNLEFFVMVENEGNVDLNGILVSLYMTVNETDELLGEQNIDLLLPWAEKRIDFELRFNEKWYNGTLKVVADVDANVRELDEKNELRGGEPFIRVVDVPVFKNSNTTADDDGTNPVIIIILLLVVVVIIYKKVISKKLASKKKKLGRDEKDAKPKKTGKKEIKKIEEEELHLLATDEIDEKLKKLEDSL